MAQPLPSFCLAALTSVDAALDTQHLGRAQPTAAWQSHSHRPTLHTRGAALLEWLLALALMATLAALAGSHLQAMAHAMQTTSVSQTLVRSLRMAQHEALRRSADVEVQPLVCARLLDIDHDWSCGWQIFIDRNGNRAFDADTDTAVGLITPPYASDISSTRAALRFGSKGTTSYVQTFQINQRQAVKVAWARIQVERTP